MQDVFKFEVYIESHGVAYQYATKEGATNKAKAIKSNGLECVVRKCQ